VTTGSGDIGVLAGTLAIDPRMIENLGDIPLATAVLPGTLNISGGGSLDAGWNLGILAGDIDSTAGWLHAGNNAFIGVGRDIRLNNSDLIAENDIYMRLFRADSMLYINDAPGMSASTVWAKSPHTIYLDFPNRAGGGVVIDGAATTTTTYPGSGFYVGDPAIAAAPGRGLVLSHQAGLNSAISDTFNRADRSGDALSDAPGTSLPPLARRTEATAPDDQTAGGGEGEFGGDGKQNRGRRPVKQCRG
jgi:hypothetical protein